MRNLYKILAIGLAVLMCVSVLAVNVRAAVIEIKPGDKPPATNDPTNGNQYEDFSHGPNDPNEDENPDEDPYDYYDGGDYFEDYFDEDDTEEKKEEEKTDQGGEYRERILKLIFRVGNKDMEKYINEDLTIIKMDAAPYIKDGRNMVGVRYVAEGLEMQVTWDAKTRTVFIEDDMFKIEIPVDTNKIIVNGQVMESDVMPEFVNGRTMLPIANIARALGLKDGEDIFWDNVEKKATIIRVLSAK